MISSEEYINTLVKFYDLCLTHGAVKVTRQDSDVFTLYVTEKKFFHFTEVLAVKVSKVCWLFPKLAHKNLEILRKVIKYGEDGYLCTLRVKRNGGAFGVYVVNNTGKSIYKKTCRYFSLNIFKNKPTKGTKKSKKATKVSKASNL